MSSPRTPKTSIKAAPLHTSRPKIREKSSSFQSTSTLNIFHKKPPPHHPSSPFEPHEVGPGIWSTDATAFERFKLRVQRAEPEARPQEIKRKPVHIRDSLDRCKQARFIGRTEQCSTYKKRDGSEAAIQFRQEERDEQKTKRESDWPGARRGKMRTVSRDDQLIVRGANPRTGLVSPFIVSDDSEECFGGGYIAMDKFGSAGPLPRKRTRSGKWKQDSLGWSLVESPLLSPIAQSMSNKMSRTVSTKQLEDRLLFQMPDVDDPNPKVMTDRQIKKYQENITRAYKRGGGSITMLDPDTIPSPREWTPERPSTPTTKLHKIQRKEVGSGIVRKNNSADTVIINAYNQASSLPTPRKDIMKWQKDRIITPSNTPKGSSFESCTNISNAKKTTDHFLGRGSGTACSLTASAIQSQSHLNAGQAHQSHQNESESSPSPTLSNPPRAAHTLSQYLPRLQFLHPSHFANLETSFYRRPMLRSAGQKGRAVEGACTTTFTTTSRKKPAWEQRPKMQRHGKEVMPRVNQLSPGYEKPRDGHHQEVPLRNKQSCSSDTLVDTLHTLGLMTRSRTFGPIEKADPTRDLARTRFQTNTQMPAEFPRQAPCENRSRDFASTTLMTQGLSLGNANVAPERIQRNLSGDGCTPTYGPLGNESGAVPGGRVHYISDDKKQAVLPADLTISDDSNAWFAGRQAKVKEEGEHPNLTTLTKEETLARRPPVLRKATDVKWWLYAAEAWVESLAKLGPVRQPVDKTICHIIRTLSHASLAINTLRMANATPRERFRAMKDLTLATFYLLVLLNLLGALRRILGNISKVLYCVWYHPTQAILTIIRWCVVG